MKYENLVTKVVRISLITAVICCVVYANHVLNDPTPDDFFDVNAAVSAIPYNIDVVANNVSTVDTVVN